MLRFHHLGIVVQNIDLAMTNFITINPAFREISRDVVETEQVKIVLVGDGAIVLEFIEPISDFSAISDFLKVGGGMHHICFETDNMDEYIAKNKENIKQIKKRHKGFFGYDTCFFVQRSFVSGFFLYELVEIIQT